MKKLIHFAGKVIPAVTILVILLVSFAFRNHIANRDLADLEAATGNRFAPFLVESAVMYSYINRCADGENIAASDPALAGMSHRSVAEQMSLSLEYAGGFLLKIYRSIYGTEPEGVFERSYNESRFLRHALTWYLALVPVLIFLLLRKLKVPVIFALMGSLVQIFSAAALGRYTGQDLIKGAFALPWITLFLYCYATAIYGKYKSRKFALLGSMLATAVACASWDAAQLVIGLLALSEIVLLIACGSANTKQRNFWACTFIAMTVTTLLAPYCQAHGSFFSPALQFAIPGAVLLNTLPAKRRTLWQLATLTMLLLWSVTATWISPFAGNYSHFAELLAAKIRFHNVLPKDPGVLTFDQRYLWTPELHSATWQITRWIYPAALPLAMIMMVFLLAVSLFGKVRKKNLAVAEKLLSVETARYFMLTTVMFILYIFFMRYRDMTMLFTAILLPLAATRIRSKFRGKIVFIILLLLLTAAAVLEWRGGIRVRRGYSKALNYTSAMIKELRKYDFNNQVILADMHTSSYLKGYTNASILIQAKYELPEVRAVTQEFILTFFNEPLNKFVDFCAENKVDYLLLHVPMVTTPMDVPYSYRYMSCSPTLKKDSAAMILGMNNQQTGNFYEIILPQEASTINGYRLYKFISPRQRKSAELLTERAWRAYYTNRRATARKLIRRAYLRAPGSGMIYEAYVQICREIPPDLTPPHKAEIAK